MGWVVYIPLLCALALASAPRRSPCRHTAPAWVPAMLVPVALAAALAADAALVILVGARLIDAAPLAAVLGWRAEAGGPHPVPLPVSVAAAVALIVVVVFGQGRMAADVVPRRAACERCTAMPSPASSSSCGPRR